MYVYYVLLVVTVIDYGSYKLCDLCIALPLDKVFQ